MMGQAMKQPIVKCLWTGEVITAYEFGALESIGPTVPPSHAPPACRAKVKLATEHLAHPLTDGKTFQVKWP